MTGPVTGVASGAATPAKPGEASAVSDLAAECGVAPDSGGHAPIGHSAGFFALALGSIGVVFGDIGTSPIYAFHDALSQAAAGQIGRHDILGVVSLALWALILVVTVKYVFFIMRADNKGEGGVLSLMALAQRALGRRTMFIFILGVLGAALFYGDAIITPAVSVMSAIEGLRTIGSIEHQVTTKLVMLISVAILVVLFFVQSRGTAKVGVFFGPICAVWFIAIFTLGVPHILQQPEVFYAINPLEAGSFLFSHGRVGFLVLGAVFLTVTGAEALSADMGHFGRWPIQSAWLSFVFPCLVVNYLGQGAFALQVLHENHVHHRIWADHNWFFEMAPEALRPALVLLAGAATVIASQAVITGAYSLTQQAIQLGLLPRMDVRRTSETQTGQIYLPNINSMLLIGVLVVVFLFKSSSALTQAYGLAVTGTMVVTTTLGFIIAWKLWKWPLWLVIVVIAPMLALDIVFLSANSTRLLSGGWLPLSIGAVLFGVMATWVRGTGILATKTRRDSVPLTDLIEMLRARPPHRAPGTAIFLTSDPDVAPVALMHNLKHNKVLHERNIILTVHTADTPRVPDSDRISIENLNDDFKKVVLNFGFMETPNVPKALGLTRRFGLKFDIMATSFFLGRRSVVPAAQSGMPLWQDRLFIFLMKNSGNPTDFFHIPPGRVVELGAQVTV